MSYDDDSGDSDGHRESVTDWPGTVGLVRRRRHGATGPGSHGPDACGAASGTGTVTCRGPGQPESRWHCQWHRDSGSVVTARRSLTRHWTPRRSDNDSILLGFGLTPRLALAEVQITRLCPSQ